MDTVGQVEVTSTGATRFMDTVGQVEGHVGGRTRFMDTVGQVEVESRHVSGRAPFRGVSRFSRLVDSVDWRSYWWYVVHGWNAHQDIFRDRHGPHGNIERSNWVRVKPKQWIDVKLVTSCKLGRALAFIFVSQAYPGLVQN